MKPLIVFTWPRDIPQFVDHFDRHMRNIPYDRLIAKYTPSDIVYHLARKVFLQREEKYTHYIYATDDLIFRKEDVDRIIEDYNRWFPQGQQRETNVLCADVNLDMEDKKVRGFMLYGHRLPVLKMNVSHTVMSSEITLDMYHFAHQDDYEVRRYKELDQPLRCAWTAMALAVIPRDVIATTTFRNDLEYVKSRIPAVHGCCIDLVFAIECRHMGFDIYTDLNVNALHLKPSVVKNLWYEQYFEVNKKTPEWYILKADTDERVEISMEGGYDNE